MLLTDNEATVIARIYKNCKRISINRKPIAGTFDLVSDREYDLEIEGITNDGLNFSAWLPLAMIGAINWCEPSIANMTDYPEMTRSGDWSGVRDSRDEAIWNIVDTIYDGILNETEQLTPR